MYIYNPWRSAYRLDSWIQGHPEYGFDFKALVCHDGVFDATYNGYSTDELFFVSDLPLMQAASFNRLRT